MQHVDEGLLVAYADGALAAGHPAREVGEPPRLGREAHRPRHLHRVLGLREGGVHEDAVHPLLHRQRRVGGSADPGVDDHRNLKPRLDEPDAVRIDESEPAPDRRGERHHRRAPGVLQSEGGDQVVVGVGEDGEAGVEVRVLAADRIAQRGEHLLPGHAQLQLRHHFLRHEIALLDVNGRVGFE